MIGGCTRKVQPPLLFLYGVLYFSCAARGGYIYVLRCLTAPMAVTLCARGSKKKVRRPMSGGGRRSPDCFRFAGSAGFLGFRGEKAPTSVGKSSDVGIRKTDATLNDVHVSMRKYGWLSGKAGFSQRESDVLSAGKRCSFSGKTGFSQREDESVSSGKRRCFRK